jgi:protein MpaA
MKMIRQFRPTRVLAVHAPLYCVNFDGPADSLAGAMARASGYPLKPSIGYPTPGSLGSYAGIDLRLPTITLELPGKISGAAAWKDLEEALLIFLDH